MHRARARGWAEQDIGLSIPRLPFLGTEPPPCAARPEMFTLAAEDNRTASATRIQRRRIVTAERLAKAVCADCPALAGCREYALATRQLWGVWGGTNALEREAWARNNRRAKGDTVKSTGKFDDIPTIELFNADGLRATARKNDDDTARKRTVPAVARGNCPNCLTNPAAIVKQGAHHVWRAHNYRTWGGEKRQCSASGVALCVAPEPAGKPYNATPARCPHPDDDGPPASAVAA